MTQLTTIEFIAGFWTIDFTVAAFFHGDARPVLAREFIRATFAPVFHFVHVMNVSIICLFAGINWIYGYPFLIFLIIYEAIDNCPRSV